MNSSSWYTIFSRPRSTTLFTLLAVIAFAFTSLMAYRQWEQLAFQREKASIALATEPRTLSQLQREILHLQLLLRTAEVKQILQVDRFISQREEVTERLNVWENHTTSNELYWHQQEDAHTCQDAWIALQPTLDDWEKTADPELLTDIMAKLTMFEGEVNRLIGEQTGVSEQTVSAFNASVRTNTAALQASAFGSFFLLSALLVGLWWSSWRLVSSQRALLASEEALRTTLDVIPDAVGRITREGMITAFHPGSASGFQFDSIGVVGKHVAHVLPISMSEKLLGAIRKSLDQGVEQTFDSEMNLAADNSKYIGDNSNHIFEVRVMPISKNEVQGMMRNVTKERQKDEALLQSQKLESLGMLAGGLAHDFNNILAGIMGQASLAKMRLEKGKNPISNIDKTLTATKKAADLTRQLLAYAGRGQFQIETLDINALIQDNISLLETVLPKGIKLDVDLSPYATVVEADKGQIQQILLNLVINAGDAIGAEGGAIQVRTGIEVIDLAVKSPEWQKEYNVTAGHYAFFEVKDHGVGMPSHVLSKIFDPFFTTKKSGHGLGLSATLGVVGRHNGCVRVASMEGAGSRFRILFPLIEQFVPVPERREITQLAADCRGTVLVIDDEERVQEVVRETLESCGMVLLSAENGRDGVDLFMAHHLTIDLIVLDMVMPEMNGDEACTHIRRIAPDVPIICSSGYSESAALKSMSSVPNVRFLQKPYHAEALIQMAMCCLSNDSVDNERMGLRNGIG